MTMSTSSTANKTVLALEKVSSSTKPAFLLDSTGRHDKLECLTTDPDIKSGTCFFNWKNELYIYSTYFESFNYDSLQISKLVGYNFEVIGEDRIRFSLGTCTNMGDRKLMFCFGESSEYSCNWAAKPLDDFFKLASTEYGHKDGGISCSQSKFFCQRSSNTKV